MRHVYKIGDYHQTNCGSLDLDDAVSVAYEVSDCADCLELELDVYQDKNNRYVGDAYAKRIEIIKKTLKFLEFNKDFNGMLSSKAEVEDEKNVPKTQKNG